MSILQKIADWLKPKPLPTTAYYILDDGHPAAEIQTRYGAMIQVYMGADSWWNMTPDLKELQEQRRPADREKPVQKTPCTREEALEAAHKFDERVKQKVLQTVTDYDPLGEKAGYYIYGQHYYTEQRALDAYTNYLRKGRDPKITVKLWIDWCPSPDTKYGYHLRYDLASMTEEGDYEQRELIRQKLADRWWKHMKDGNLRTDRYAPEEVFQ